MSRLRRAGPAARHRRARHLVQLGPLAVRHLGLAGRDAGPRVLLSHERAQHGARDHLPLGRAHGHDGPRVRRRDPLHRRLHPLRDPGRRRAPHEQVARHRHRPARDDRQVRRRRHALRPADDVEHPGRALQRREDRHGAQLRQQALERVAARAAGERGLRGARAATRIRSTAGSRAGSDAASRRVEAAVAVYDFTAAVDTLYHFVWDEFCDWYLELAKVRLYSEDEAERREAAGHARWMLDQIVRLLHPFLPYVTEEVAAQYGAAPLLAQAHPRREDFATAEADEAAVGRPAGARQRPARVPRRGRRRARPGPERRVRRRRRSTAAARYEPFAAGGPRPGAHRGALRRRARGRGDRRARPGRPSRSRVDGGPGRGDRPPRGSARQGRGRGGALRGQARQRDLRRQGAGGDRGQGAREARRLHGRPRRAGRAAGGAAARAERGPAHPLGSPRVQRPRRRLGGLPRRPGRRSACGPGWSASRRCSTRSAGRRTASASSTSSAPTASRRRRATQPRSCARTVCAPAPTSRRTSPGTASACSSTARRSRPSAFGAAVRRVRDEIARLPDELGETTQFEVLTVAALLALAESGVEAVALEAGLGGRLDATNVVDAPVVVLTNIAPRAHRGARRHAGGDLRREGRGHQRRRRRVRAARRPRRGGRAGVRARRRARTPARPRRHASTATRGGSPCGRDRQSYDGLARADARPLPGRERRSGRGGGGAPARRARPSRRCATALRDRLVPGRLQVVSRDPLLLADGAHNPDGMRALVGTLAGLALPRPVVAVLAVMRDKDAEGMLRALAALGRRRRLHAGERAAQSRRGRAGRPGGGARARGASR